MQYRSENKGVHIPVSAIIYNLNNSYQRGGRRYAESLCKICPKNIVNEGILWGARERTFNKFPLLRYDLPNFPNKKVYLCRSKGRAASMRVV